jgi:hypothetical protein
LRAWRALLAKPLLWLRSAKRRSMKATEGYKVLGLALDDGGQKRLYILDGSSLASTKTNK